MLLTSVVQVAYGTDVVALMPALRSVIAGVPRVLAVPAPAVNLTAFATDGLELSFGFWIADPENGQVNVRTDVNLAILAALRAQGIEITPPPRPLPGPARPPG